MEKFKSRNRFSEDSLVKPIFVSVLFLVVFIALSLPVLAQQASPFFAKPRQTQVQGENFNNSTLNLQYKLNQNLDHQSSKLQIDESLSLSLTGRNPIRSLSDSLPAGNLRSEKKRPYNPIDRDLQIVDPIYYRDAATVDKIKTHSAKKTFGNSYTDRTVDPPYYEDYRGGQTKMPTSDDPVFKRAELCQKSIGPFNEAVFATQNAFETKYRQIRAWSIQFWEIVVTPELGPDLKQKIANYYAARIHFAEACLSNTDFSFGLVEQKKFEQIIGFFRNESGTYCTGTRISKDVVLTAAHCFFDITKINWKNIRNPLESKFFLVANKTGYNFKLIDCPAALVGNACPPRQFQASDDNVLVKLLPDADLPEYPKISFDLPKKDEQLVLLGYSNAFQGFDIKDASMYLGTARGIYGCFAKVSDIGCIQHGCQAGDGFSGAPIFRSSTDGNLTLVGIHLGADSSVVDGGQCNNNDRLIGNIGFVISSQVISIFK